jgi:low affinity Fe/Cu permease
MNINERIAAVAKQMARSRSNNATGQRVAPKDAADTNRSVRSLGDAPLFDYEDETSSPQRSITKKTSQLPFTSKLLYHIDFYSSLPIVSVTAVGIFAIMIIVGIVLGFPTAWVKTFEVTASTVTLLMVFTIQHTQGREQVATQRKLDELLRATPGAAEALMMLEEAPREFMMEVEDFHRETRADIVDDTESDAPRTTSYDDDSR